MWNGELIAGSGSSGKGDGPGLSTEICTPSQPCIIGKTVVFCDDKSQMVRMVTDKWTNSEIWTENVRTLFDFSGLTVDKEFHPVKIIEAQAMASELRGFLQIHEDDVFELTGARAGAQGGHGAVSALSRKLIAVRARSYGRIIMFLDVQNMIQTNGLHRPYNA